MKNSIFGAIVAVVVCACIFSILCVTDVISFNKNNKVNNTNNNTQKDVKETKLCEKAETIDGKEYKMVFYKLSNSDKNNKIELLIDNKSIYSVNQDYYINNPDVETGKLMNSKSDCENYISDDTNLFNIKKITSDSNYNYYLLDVSYLNDIAVSENKTTKEYKSLKDFGNHGYPYGVVTYEAFQSNPEINTCLDRKRVDIVDNYISELVISTSPSKITVSNGEKEMWTADEEKYVFKDGNIEKVTSNQKYVVVCNTPW